MDRQAAGGDVTGADRSADLEQPGDVEVGVHRRAVAGRATLEGGGGGADRVGARKPSAGPDGDLVEAVDALPGVAFRDGRAVIEGEGGAVDGDDLPGALEVAVGGGDLDPVADEVGRDRGLVGDEGDARAAGLGDAGAERGQYGRAAVAAAVVDDQITEGRVGSLEEECPRPAGVVRRSARGVERAFGKGEGAAVLERDRASATTGPVIRWGATTLGLDHAQAGNVAGHGEPDRPTCAGGVACC